MAHASRKLFVLTTAAILVAASIVAFERTAMSSYRTASKTEKCGVAFVDLGEPVADVKNVNKMAKTYTGVAKTDFAMICENGDDSDCRVCVRSYLQEWSDNANDWVHKDAAPLSITDLLDCGESEDFPVTASYPNLFFWVQI